MYTVMYNGETAESHYLLVSKRPDIPSAEDNMQVYTLPQMDGDLYIYDGTVKDVEISIEFNFISEPIEWMKVQRGAVTWLNRTDDRRLYLGDDPEWFYKVKKIKIDETQRKARQIGTLTVSFICEGYCYHVDGAEKTSDRSIYNDYSICHPVYYIRGEGVCNLNVNGNTMRANVGQSLTIDTERKLAYRSDGTLLNTSVTGDYEKLYLRHGDNNISVTNGFTLETKTNMRCRL